MGGNSVIVARLLGMDPSAGIDGKYLSLDGDKQWPTIHWFIE